MIIKNTTTLKEKKVNSILIHCIKEQKPNTRLHLKIYALISVYLKSFQKKKKKKMRKRSKEELTWKKRQKVLEKCEKANLKQIWPIRKRKVGKNFRSQKLYIFSFFMF